MQEAWMSGHNRWTKIKRKKEAQGAAKGKLFTKLIKEITVAARTGGGDPEGNARLRSAIDAAKEANMPSDNITRAIKKGTGELEGVNYEEVIYEGYGPGGVAVLVETLTDNRNRTVGEVRAAFTKGGGSLGESNSVAWMFDRRGVITVPQADEDALMEAALEAGALDVINDGEEGFEVRTEPNDVHKIRGELEKKGFKVTEAKATYLPQNTVKLDEEKAPKMLRMMELLEDNDDVQNVFANFEIDDALLDKLAG
jgi:YebC/PmpR family DNA-binding regulatory protein